MSIDALHPIAGSHAIQSAAFILQWPVPLDRESLELVKALTEKFKPWFPVVQEQRSVTFNIGTDQSAQEAVAPQHEDLSGVHFLQPNPALGPAGVTRSIQVQRDHLNIVVNDYTRWDKAWPEMDSWLQILLPIILNGRPVSGAILQYNDVFEWRGNPADIVLDEILRVESKYLTKNIFDANSVWHLHQGVVVTCSDPVSHQLIENVNISLGDINSRRALSIFTSHHAILDTPLWEFSPQKNELTALADVLHARNKNVIREVLTTNVCKKINLI
jgi:uncharacterized protein (TIGR04255 family)